jgi:hypothetical protein
MLVGYMRVSTDGDRQVLDLQRDLHENMLPLAMTAAQTDFAVLTKGKR